jgi:hypothetical protein
MDDVKRDQSIRNRQVDAFKRHSTTEVKRFLAATGADLGTPDSVDGGGEMAITAAAAKAAAAVAALEGLSVADDNMATAVLRNNQPKRPSGRRSPLPPMAGGSSARGRATSPVPSPCVSPRSNKNNDGSGDESAAKHGEAASKRMVDAIAARPAGIVISSPKAVGGGSKAAAAQGGVRSSLRAQALLGGGDAVAAPHRERDTDMPHLLRPDSPGTPLAASPASTELLLDGLNTPLVGTPLGSPTAAGRIGYEEEEG